MRINCIILEASRHLRQLMTLRRSWFMLEIAVLWAIRVQKISQTMLEFKLEFTIQLFKCDKFSTRLHLRQRFVTRGEITRRSENFIFFRFFNAKLSRKETCYCQEYAEECYDDIKKQLEIILMAFSLHHHRRYLLCCFYSTEKKWMKFFECNKIQVVRLLRSSLSSS